MVTGEIDQEHPEAEGRRQHLGQQRSMTPQDSAGKFEDEIENGIRIGDGLVGPAGHMSSLNIGALFSAE